MEISLDQHKESLNGESKPTMFSSGSSEDINIENLEIASYLDLKEDVFDSDVMSKVSELRGFFGDLESLKAIDFKLGNPIGNKLDKLYTYMLLNKEEHNYQEKIEDINRQKEYLYGRTS